MKDSEINKYDHWLLSEKGPAALVIREHLLPIEGRDGVIFPPTFAAGDGFPGGYNIDPPATRDEPWKSPNVCIIDTVGSQANRIEPIFAEDEYAKLIPKILIIAGKKRVNILEVGHRAGDALVRCSELQEKMHAAFIELLNHNAEPLAKIAPTSLVFGVWDSRDTQAKLPRLVSSVIRAFNVEKLTRGAVYIPPVDYAALEVFSEADKAKAEGNKKNPLAQRGFVHNPASGSHGGVIAKGGIRRDASLSLAALQLLKAGTDNDGKTLVLRRYIFGIALVALTANNASYLRQGCQLVIDPEKPAEFVAVYRDGRREPSDISHTDALKFAKVAAEDFGVGDDQTVDFQNQKAKTDVKKKDQ